MTTITISALYLCIQNNTPCLGVGELIYLRDHLNTGTTNKEFINWLNCNYIYESYDLGEATLIKIVNYKLTSIYHQHPGHQI